MCGNMRTRGCSSVFLDTLLNKSSKDLKTDNEHEYEHILQTVIFDD